MKYQVKETIDIKIKKYINDREENSSCNMGNSILYEMCKKYPTHTDQDIIRSKIWLIGRSYAAALERTNKKGTEYKKDFYKNLGNDLLEKTEIRELDQIIMKLNKYNNVNYDNIEQVLESHKKLVDIFSKIVNIEKRSLASKYLHFHCPQMFFIFDNRAKNTIKKFVQRNRANIPADISIYDKEYEDFCYRALSLVEYINNKYTIKFKPRDLDNLLLFTED